MKKKVPAGEVAILIFLLIFSFYWFVLYQPYKKEMAQIAVDKAAAEQQIVVNRQKIQKMNTMQAAVDEAFAEANGTPVPIPEYNNINNKIAELHAILGNVATYSIDFDTEVINKSVATRNISITYTTDSYDETLVILRAIHDSRNTCLITDISWNDRRADDLRNYGESYFNEIIGPITVVNRYARYEVKLKLRCYEYVSSENE